MFELNKFSLIILTRCNLRCKLCCEYVPQNSPFPDMTLEEERRILEAVFRVADRIGTLHLTGGGEPMLHPDLAEMVCCAMDYSGRFDRLMLFTNTTVPLSEHLLSVLHQYREKLIVQTSLYGKNHRLERNILQSLQDASVRCKIVKYYGEEQDFGGWVDFGPWEKQNHSPASLEQRFQNCSVTSVLRGNWRTRDGKVHWCSRSQRGVELGKIPDDPRDYVDLFDESSIDEKRDKFRRIAASRWIAACDHCSGDAGTADTGKRFAAAEQEER